VLVLRFLVPILGLWLVGLVIAYVVTKDRKYLRISWLTLQVVLLLLVAFGLFYIFERVLLML
jgi:nucleoside permease NupC